MRMESDLIDALEATIDGHLDELALKWSSKSALCVVAASGGYPGDYQKGEPIAGLDEVAALENVEVFHAGTTAGPEGVVTSGGRVLGVTALGETVHQARQRAYEGVRLIAFNGAYVRGDIGMRISTR